MAGTADMGDAVVLTGSRVRLRAPRLQDAEALFASIASDPEVTRYLSWTPHPDVAETRRVISEMYNVGDERTWLIEMRDTSDVVGLCACWRSAGHAVEIGYCLARALWGHRIMYEVLGILLETLQEDQTVYRVWATCHVDNTRSARLLRRAGFSLEGRLTRYGMYPNLSPEPHDSLLFAKALR